MWPLTIHDAPLGVHLAVLDVRVLDGRVIVGDKQLLEELDGERRLADAAVAHHHQLVGGEVAAGRRRFGHGAGPLSCH